MNYIKDINLKDNDTYKGIIEIPIGCKLKYELDENSFDKLSAVRKLKLRYPFYYGCFPQTYAGDGDPLDMILLSKKKRQKLDIVNVYPIGVIKTIDDGLVDDKVICIAKDEAIKDLRKLEKIAVKFLSLYKGKNSNTQTDFNIYDCQVAEKIIAKSSKAYLDKCTNRSAIKSTL